MVGQLRRLLDEHREELVTVARRHRASNVRVFGSVARGEDADGSDVDFLVDFEPGATLLDLADIKDEFAAFLGRSAEALLRSVKITT